MPAVAVKQIDPPVTDDPDMIDGKWKGKWWIYDPRTVNAVERTDFLKSLCGHIDQSDALEDILRNKPALPRKRADGTYIPQEEQTAHYEMIDLAKTYYKYKNKGARLPKFSRWVSGMFSGNTEYAKILADEGQKAAARKIIVSVDKVDILRCAATPHFASCFARPEVEGKGPYAGTGYSKIPVKIAEECPGIGIVYVDDENGMMLGRHWFHHAKLKKTGEDIVVLTQSRYGCLQGENVARLLAKKFNVKAGLGSYYGDDLGNTEVEYIGCFDKEIHHDLSTWRKPAYVSVLDPLKF